MLSKIKDKIYNNKNKESLVFFDKLAYRFKDHRIIDMSASLVYFAILSFFPFLIALLNALKFTNLLESEAFMQTMSYLPDSVTNIANPFIEEISNSSSSSLLSISILAGLYTASNGIHKLVNNLNLSYGFVEDRGFVKTRLLSLIFTISFILMAIILVITQIFGELIIKTISSYIGLEKGTTLLMKSLGILIPFLYIFIVFLLVYRFAPNSKSKILLTFKSVLPGSLFAAVFSVIASSAFGFYVSNFGKYSITYGSLGGVIVMLIWMWIIGIIFLLGGEINATLYSINNFPSTNLWPRRESVVKNVIKDYEM
ncbi:MAG: YihY/virulence factor BrkB family protein [Peptoniphilaceae bacterium]